MLDSGYNIEVSSWFGDYEDCVITFDVTHPNGKKVKEKRMGKAPKGIFRTSIYGIKFKVDLSTNTII